MTTDATMIGRVYKLSSGDLDYYGSTVVSLNARKHKHKYAAKVKQGVSSQKLYETGLPVIMELLEEVAITQRNNDPALAQRERYYIDNFPCVNHNRPAQTIEEKHEQQKLWHTKRTKAYRRRSYLLTKFRRRLNDKLLKTCFKAWRNQTINTP